MYIEQLRKSHIIIIIVVVVGQTLNLSSPPERGKSQPRPSISQSPSSSDPLASTHLEQLCAFVKDEARIFAHFRTNLEKLCAAVREKSEVKLTVERVHLVDVGVTQLRYQLLEVPLICLYEAEQLSEEIRREKTRRAEEARNKPLTVKIVNFARTPASLPRSTTTTTPYIWPSITTSPAASSAVAKTPAITPRVARDSGEITPQPPGPSPGFGTPVPLPKGKMKASEDDWEAVLPPRPALKVRNAFEALRGVGE